MLCPDGKVAASIVHYICSRMVILCLCVPAVFSYNIYNRWLVSYDFHAFALPCFVGTFCLVLLEQRLYTARQCTEKVSLTVFVHLSLMGCLVSLIPLQGEIYTMYCQFQIYSIGSGYGRHRICNRSSRNFGAISG